MPDTREALRQRPDVPDEDIDDIIAIAARLQDDDRAAEEGRVAVEDVEAVAAELDIDPRYVEDAIGVLQAERAAAEQAEAKRTAQTRKALGFAGVGVIALVALGALGWGMTRAVQTTGEVVQNQRREAQRARTAQVSAEVRQAEEALAAVLDRQAGLVTQVAATGAPTERLQKAARRVRNAQTIEAKLAASEELEEALTAALAALPPAQTPAQEQQRLSLQYEITGSSNRIAVERRRWQQAKAR